MEMMELDTKEETDLKTPFKFDLRYHGVDEVLNHPPQWNQQDVAPFNITYFTYFGDGLSNIMMVNPNCVMPNDQHHQQQQPDLVHSPAPPYKYLQQQYNMINITSFSPTEYLLQKKKSRTLAATGWHFLPDRIFGDIMMMVDDVERLKNLLKCRQVCQSWNVMISKMTRKKINIIKKSAENLATQMKEKFVDGYNPNLPELVTAGMLAHHGFLGSVEGMVLQDVDLASIQASHLASLVSCVTEYIDINNIKICDPIPLLENIKCDNLYISNQALGTEETKALVRVMESHVKMVKFTPEPNLDIKELMQYSGKGKCDQLHTDNALYRNELISLAKRINWAVCFCHGVTIRRDQFFHLY